MIEKIATGKVEAFLKDVTLMPQAWVRDGEQDDRRSRHGAWQGRRWRPHGGELRALPARRRLIRER
jgi:hypothetical protein